MSDKDQKNFEEVSVLEIFRQLYSGMKKVYRDLLSALEGLIRSVLVIIKRNYWIFIAAALLGASAGAYLDLKVVPKQKVYVAKMIVRANVGSEYKLSGAIEEYNNLIQSALPNILADKLGLTIQEASELRSFHLGLYPGLQKKQTSSPVYEVKVMSFNQNAFKKIEKTMMHNVEQDIEMKTLQQSILANFKLKDSLLRAALRNIDEVREAFLQGVAHNRAGERVFASRDSEKNLKEEDEQSLPEHLLFIKERINIVREMVNNDTEMLAFSNVVKVLKPFPEVGKVYFKDSDADKWYLQTVWRSNIFRLPLVLMAFGFAATVFVMFIKRLNNQTKL